MVPGGGAVGEGGAGGGVASVEEATKGRKLAANEYVTRARGRITGEGWQRREIT